jgi:nucleoside-diphosphate-sugar epimerase
MSARSTEQHVVTGAGPVARAVVDALVRRGVTPTVVTRRGTEVAGATPRAADLTDPTAAREALTGAAVVYQCAQPRYHRWAQEFPPLQRSILDACATHGAVLVAVENLYGYGPVTGAMHERLPLAATTRKGRVRAALWNELAAAHASGHVRTVAARASDFIGPHVAGSAFGERFFGPLVAGKGAEVLGDPERLHTVTYVPDLGEAMVRLGETPAAWGSAWHVPNAPAVSVRRLVEMASAAAGVTPSMRRMGALKLRLGGLFIPEARETVEMLYEFTHDFVVDHSAYAALIGDHATPLDVSIPATVRSFIHS